MLVRTFTLVCRVLGQSHVDLGLEFVAEIAVLENVITDTSLDTGVFLTCLLFYTFHL